MTVSDQHQTLLDLAAEAFARHGYAGASVRTITDAAQMNPAMVGYYFRSKEGLFRAVLDDRDARIRERMDWAERGAESSGNARQRAYLFAVLEEFPEFLHILFAEAVLASEGFPAADCRELLAQHRKLVGDAELLDRLASELLSSPTPLMNHPRAERRALAEALAPRVTKKRKPATVQREPVAPPTEQSADAPSRYTQPSHGDDFLDGFVD